MYSTDVAFVWKKIWRTIKRSKQREKAVNLYVLGHKPVNNTGTGSKKKEI